MNTQSAIPTAVIAELNRAAHSASVALKYEHGLIVSRRDLRKFADAVVAEQAALTGGRHPATPHALAFLHEVMRDMMIEHATAE